MTEPGAGGLSVFILAGGKSRRMGRDKAFVELNGRKLLDRTLEVGRSVADSMQADSVQIVGSREKFAQFAPVVQDIFFESGPLGGIHAALLASASQLNLILAVDMPFVTPQFLKYLVGEARNAPSAKATVPRTGGRWQPVCAIYRRDFATAAENALREGRGKIGLLLDSLLDLMEVRCIEEHELERAGFSAALFRNLNTLEELQAEEQRA